MWFIATERIEKENGKEKDHVLKLKESTVQRKKVGTDAQHHRYSTIHTLALHIWHSSQESTVHFITLY